MINIGKIIWGIHMRKKYNDVRINSIERYLKNNPLDYLDYINKNKNEEEILKVLKYAGFFVTDRNETLFSNDTKCLIKNWVKDNLSNNSYKKFRRLSKEGDKLNKKRDQIKKDILKIKLMKCSYLKLLERFNTQISINLDILSKTSSEYEQEQYKASSENIILGLGILLRNGFTSGESTYYQNTDDKDVIDILVLIQLLNLVNDIIGNWMFGDVEVKTRLFNKLYISENHGIITDRIFSFLEYNDLNNAKTLKYFDNKNDIIKYSNSFREKLKEFFYSDDLTEEYLGIKLERWVSIYTYFYKLTINEKNVLKIDIDKLKYDLSQNKFSVDEIKAIFNHLVFGKSKNDLFSSFLIEYNNFILMLPSIIKMIEPLKSIMVLFTNNNEIFKKGSKYENYIHKLLLSYNHSAIKNVKTNSNGKSYELDILLYIDNTLFIIECKTQFQHDNVRGYCRNIQELDYYIDKFKRNLKYFTKDENGKKSINSRLKDINCNIDNVNVVPILLTNISYPFVEREGIYILKDIKLYNFITGNQPMIHYLDNKNKKYFQIGMLSPELFRNKKANTFIDFLRKNNNYEISPYCAIEKNILNDKLFKRYKLYITRRDFNKDKYYRIIEKYCKQEDKLNSLK
ncbi:hypothetical protein O3802_05475 [Gemella sp. 27098_8_92]|uniref:hypothetical protein n=1 Tax=Gemella sp. 27098_8_92 TaxID=3003687 RepID=UPI00352BD530